MRKRYTQVGFNQGHDERFVGSILIESDDPESLDWVDIGFKVFETPPGTILAPVAPILNVLHPDEAMISQQPRFLASDYKVWVLRRPLGGESDPAVPES